MGIFGYSISRLAYKQADLGNRPMTMLYSRYHKLHDLSGDDAYRSWLISRNQPPIVYHSGEMHVKRLQVTLRRAAKTIRSLFAAARVAVVADEMRRSRGELAQPDGRKHDGFTT